MTTRQSTPSTQTEREQAAAKAAREVEALVRSYGGTTYAPVPLLREVKS